MSLVEIVGIEGYIQTTYLVVYPDRLLLLDSGCRSDVDVILFYITETLNRPVEQLKTVVITHMHPDHAGGAELLKQKTGCQIVSGATYKPWYHGVKGRVQHLKDLALTSYVASRNSKQFANQWYRPILKSDIFARDGDRVPGFEDWIIKQTPGHTDCDLSLWHQPTNQVYVADLILRINKKLVSPYEINLPESYKASLNTIKALQPSRVLLAHGGQLHLSADDFDKLIAKAPAYPRKMKLLDTLNIKLPRFMTR